MTNQETIKYLLAKIVLQEGAISDRDREEIWKALGWDGMTRDELKGEVRGLIDTIGQEGRRLDAIAPESHGERRTLAFLI